jgi:hypothetical protein
MNSAPVEKAKLAQNGLALRAWASTQSLNPNFDGLFGLVDLLLWWGALFEHVD